MNKLINKLNSQKGKAGFTIIEVLIVLAIGALIILAVLLAVPALQRNQKNSQKKAEASRVATAVNQWISDGGSCTASTCSVDAAQVKATAKSADFKQLTTDPSVVTFATIPSPLSPTTAYVITNAQCSGTTVATAGTTTGTGTAAVTTSDNSKIVVGYLNDGATTLTCLPVQS